jgi:acetylornithine deacetylase/succinyl-diaminopimelate desuccinylase-like protein
MNEKSLNGSASSDGSEVVQLLHELIRIDTTSGLHSERPAAEWVAEKLEEVGISTRIVESAPGRASVLARIEGTDPSRRALLVHGHLDVVPADASEWSRSPFGGDVVDGYVWGRGAVDMKDMDAMVLTVVRDWARRGVRPARDIVLAFIADEEAGGAYGSHHLVDHHAEQFTDCSEAIGEVGGFSLSLSADARLYMIQTAEKGIDWLRLTASGRPGHGSMIHDDNAVASLAHAVSRIGSHTFPLLPRPEISYLISQMAEILGEELDPDQPDAWLDRLGGMARMIGAAMRNTANPTGLSAGYLHNVIPSKAEATIDARFIPGHEDELLADLTRLAGDGLRLDVTVHGAAVETTFEGDLVEAMCSALRSEDSGAYPVPYLLSGGTDAKSFAELGIRCFGFAPLRLPAELDFASLFHGIDERVPIDALEFGVRVLSRFLETA